MKWGNGKTVAIDKIAVELPAEAALFDIYEMDGELHCKAIGSPPDFDKGRSLDWYMTNDNNWTLVEEVENADHPS